MSIFSKCIDRFFRAHSESYAGMKEKKRHSSTISPEGHIVEIDESLYSRQLYVLGHEFMHRIAMSNVLISGLGGLGVEVAKNVILGGCRHVALHDRHVTTYNDLASQFYLSSADLNKNRAEACVAKLAELNSHVRVEQLKADELSAETLCHFQAVVLCDYADVDEILPIADYCHKADKKLVVASTRGLFGQLFCDFGDAFVILDPDGEEPVSSVIESITCDAENGIVTLTENGTSGFNRGDSVIFSEVRGAVELNSSGPIEIKQLISPFVFSIGDTTKFGRYQGGGVATQSKPHQTMQFKSFRLAIDEPEIIPSDFAKMDRQNVLHLAFRCLGGFMKTNGGKMPAPRDAEQARRFVEYCKQHDVKSEITGTEAEDLLAEFAQQCSGDICPMNAVIGGVAAQEVMKGVSGKFTPLKQWLYFDALECLPADKSILTAANCQPLNNRYDAEAAIFGRQFVDQVLAKLKIFLVGSGAIGCEMLKNFAMLGVGCSSGGNITVTDMDLIERSNLNRQFLFRKSDLDQPKSERAAAAIKIMNSQINITAHRNRVGVETEEVYNDDFFAPLSIVVNALDNVDARKYVDRRCVYYRKPLLESGTLGTKANVQVVLPDLTESYSSSADPPEKSFPICTIKNFPTAIEHTLAWAREAFDTHFNNSMNYVEQYINDPHFLEKTLKSPNASQALETLFALKRLLVDEKPRHFEDCVAWARHVWQENFHNQIAQMLYNFPPDAKTTEGLPFWSGSKRCPVPQDFSAENSLHMSFIIAASNLRAEMFGIEQVRDEAEITEIVSKIIVPPFEPKQGVQIAVTDQELESLRAGAIGDDADDTDRVIREIVAALPPREALMGRGYEAIEFEKDDDTNFHMDFVVAASNTRAKVYDIPPADRHKSKGIAGRIIPAIATTTSVVVGLVCLEMLKVAQGHNDIEKYKNGFLNLAFPFFAFSSPIAPKSHKYNDKKWTLWDRFVINGEPTLGELMDKFLAEERLRITMLSAGTILCFADYMDPAKQKDRKSKPIKAIVEQLSGKPLPNWQRAIVLEVCVENADKQNDDDMMLDDEEDIEVPFIQYVLNK